MAFLKVKNRAISSLAAGVSDTDTSWTVASGEGAKFPSSGDFHLTCEDEIVKCTARSGDVLTVTRAQEGTSAAAHAAGKSVELRVTAGVIENIQNEFHKLRDADGDTKVDVEESSDEDKVRMDVGGTEVFLLDNTGILDLVKQSGAGAYSSVAQSIPNQTWTVLQYNTEYFDRQNEYNPSTYRFTATRAGIYLVYAWAQLDAIADGTRVLFDCFKNGVSTRRFMDVVTGGISYEPGSACCLINLSASDYIDVRIWHNHGAARNFLAYCYFMATKVA